MCFIYLMIHYVRLKTQHFHHWQQRDEIPFNANGIQRWGAGRGGEWSQWSSIANQRTVAVTCFSMIQNIFFPHLGDTQTKLTATTRCAYLRTASSNNQNRWSPLAKIARKPRPTNDVFLCLCVCMTHQPRPVDDPVQPQSDEDELKDVHGTQHLQLTRETDCEDIITLIIK